VTVERPNARLALVASIAALLVLSGCGAPLPRPPDVPDQDLVSQLDAAADRAPQLRTAENPTNDARVTASLWDTATEEAASPAQVDARPEAAPPSGLPTPTNEPLLVRDPSPALAPRAGPDSAVPPTESGPMGVVFGGAPPAPPPAPGAPVEFTDPGLAGLAIGRLFYTAAGVSRSCTAAVVTSASGLVAVTAGHCLLSDGGDGTRIASQNLMFVPGYRNGGGPAGRYFADRVSVTAGWSRGTDWAHDVGFLRLRPDGDVPIQSRTGALGLVFGASTGQATTLVGYPAARGFFGNLPYACSSGASTATPTDPAAPSSVAVPCSMTQGYSGGPGLINGAYVAAIGSHDYGTGTAYLARLDIEAVDALREADRQ
jgi:V8-like Glu-specific endopeptidase